jgi:hypothetical protein
MKTRSLTILLVGASAVVIGIAAVLLFLVLRTDTTFEFRVRDKVSGRWVWDVGMSLQNRTRVGFYQSDAGLIPYRFTHLAPGATILEISAPGYQEVRLPLTLRRGANRREIPIDMIGLGIPDLGRFFVFESIIDGDIIGELRPVSTKGAAIPNHPCMDLWVGCRVSVQEKDGAPVREETEKGSTRGRELFRGQIRWSWDPAPEKQFRYSVRIPSDQMQPESSLFRVIDYLIVEPDPLKITHEEVSALMARIYAVTAPADMLSLLGKEKDRLRYFLDTSWNVRARQE